jgi:hypothetical protein
MKYCWKGGYKPQLIHSLSIHALNLYFVCTKFLDTFEAMKVGIQINVIKLTLVKVIWKANIVEFLD